MFFKHMIDCGMLPIPLIQFLGSNKMKEKTILIVEDDKALVDVLKY